MAWIDDGGPRGSRDELLARVMARGRTLRRRRRVVTGGVAGLLVVLVGVQVVALTHRSRTTTLVTASAGAGGTTSTVPVPPVTASDQPADVPATAVTSTTPATVPPAGRPGATPITPAAATTVAPRRTSTTVGGTTTSTVAGPRQPRCTPDRLLVTVTADQPTYQPGQKVTAASTVRNQSPATCWYASYMFSTGVVDSAGRTVGTAAGMIADAFADVPLAAGAMLTNTGQWDQQDCTNGHCSQAPPGTYRMTATWSFDTPPSAATTAFQLIPKP